MKTRSAAFVVLSLLVAALPAAAADSVIQRGIDPTDSEPRHPGSGGSEMAGEDSILAVLCGNHEAR